MKTIKDFRDQMAGKKVLMRVDFNVPQDKKTGEITNDLRIRQALPTIRYALDRGAKVVLMSHLGRPKGKRNDLYSLNRVAVRLSELLGREVKFAADCVGPEVEQQVAALADGEVLMLENVRFHEQEEANDREFARSLAALGDFYVSDAFGTVHRAHASTAGVAEFLPCAAGLLIEKELQYLSRATQNPDHPFIAVMGGAKVSDKIGGIKNLLAKVDTMLIGGAMAYTFLKQQGKSVGNSLVEEDQLELAGSFLQQYGDKILLPVDHVCAVNIEADATISTFDNEIPAGQIGLDIGPRTAELFAHKIMEARLVTWNGPVGYSEIEVFADGTKRVAEAMAESEAVTVVGGGETAEAVEKLGLQDRMDHVSTGGGASLAFLAGEELPGITALG